MLSQLEAHKAAILTPISDANPCGDDPKYEDSFSLLKEEIAKSGGMGQGATDWKLVEQTAIELLTKQAKELNVVAYLTAAWVRNHGLTGFVVGVETVTGVVESWWEQMYPPKKKVKPRRTALTWLETRMKEELAKCEANDRPMLLRGQNAITALKDKIYDLFEDPPVNFKSSRNLIEEYLIQNPPPPEPTATPEPAPVEPSQPAATTTSAPTPTPAVASAAAPTRSAAPVEVPALADDADAGQLLDVLARIAGQLRGLAPNSPTPYLLQRIAMWEGASQPNGGDTGETFFPAPPDAVVDALNNMSKSASWPDLLERAEVLAADDKWFWLDLQRHAAQAAKQLGWEDVLEVIQRQSYRVDQRLPGLKDLKFNDGLPFADPQTKEWLGGLSAQLASGEGGSGEAADPGAELLSDLRGHGEDGFADALAEAQSQIATAPNRRAAFQLRLAAATFCLEVDQSEWAANLLQAMLAEAEANNLAYWEPTLTARAWRLMLEAARTLKEEDDRYIDQERQAMQALAAQDLTQAGRFPKKKESL